MSTNLKKIGSLTVVLFCAMFMASAVFAASTVNTPTVVYMNNKAVSSGDATSINKIQLTEAVTSSFSTSGGKITIKIPKDLTLYPSKMVPANIARAGGEGNGTTAATDGSLVLSTSVFGSSTYPHGIYVATSGTTTATLFIYETSQGVTALTETGSAIGLMTVYKKGVGGPSSAFQYGTGQGYGTQYPLVVNFLDLTTTYTKDSASSGKVGEIYYDTTNKQIVMTLAAKGQTSGSLEKLVLEGLKVIPANTSGSGDQKFTFVDGNPDGTTSLLGITGADVTVASLVTSPLTVTGAASGTSNAPPLIPGGSTVIDGQAHGRLLITAVGSASSTNSNTITVALDNGAKYHSAAVGSGQLAGSADATKNLSVAGTGWAYWARTHTGESLTVDSNGKLVIALGTNAALAHQATIQIPRSTSTTIIDTSGLTASGNITATVTGSGTDFDGFSGTAVVADGQLKGTTVAFKESSGATDFDTLYTGRKAQTIADGLVVTEAAQGSLFAGGSIVFTLDQGAKFTSADSITSTKSTTSPYSNSELVLPNVSITSASATGTSLVTTASSSAPGQYAYSSFSFDLSNATAGDLGLTISGTAGASGTLTLCTIMNATTSSVGSSVSVVPGQSVSIPAITITENKAGALAAGKIGLKFPTGYTLDATGVSVSTTISGGTSSSNVTWGAVDSGDENYAYLTVGAQSQTSTGPYTIVVSGLAATTTTSTSSVDMKIGGASSGDWTTDSSTFNSNTGAKPTAATLSMGTLVSNTVPTITTGTAVNNVVTQTLTVAGGDFNKVGDIYVFTTGTNGKYYDGSTWSSTEAAYSAGATLGTHTIVYDVTGLATGSTVYVGYGVGLSGTVAQMNSDATFASAYTTASTVEVGKDTGSQTATQNVDDAIELYLNITNGDGVDYADIVYEWVVFGAVIGGVDTNIFFLTDNASAPSTVVAYDSALDWTTVTYTLDHSSDAVKLTDLNMGTLGLSAGDQFYYGYVYGLTGFDLADDTTWELEN